MNFVRKLQLWQATTVNILNGNQNTPRFFHNAVFKVGKWSKGIIRSCYFLFVNGRHS